MSLTKTEISKFEWTEEKKQFLNASETQENTTFGGKSPLQALPSGVTEIDVKSQGLNRR